MNMTQEQIRAEFARQVRLCSGTGRVEMIAIVCDQKPFPLESDHDRETVSRVLVALMPAARP